MRWFSLFFLFLAACNKTSPLTTIEKTYFGIPLHLLIGHTLSIQEIQNINAILEATFEEVNNVYNDWNPQSEISHFNSLPAFEKVKLSPQLVALFKEAEKLYILSKGKFDATVAPLTKAWKQSLRNGSLLSSSELACLIPAIGWEHLHEKESFFWKDHSCTAVDLGGISKGYTVDILTERLQKLGFKHLFIEWGGEVRACGGHPEGRPWHVGIKGMDDAIDIIDGALATSGDYYQCWEVEGKSYFHIIDPETCSPLESTCSSIATASVLAPTCVLADGLATILMLFPTPDEAALWVSQFDSVQFWIGKHS